MDVFTHQDALQESSGKWYFHKSGSGYKGGNYKGLDITFGQNGFGGILIRAIEEIKPSEYLEGPCNCVNHILKCNGAKEIVDFVKQKNFNLSVSKKSKLYLRKTDTLPKLEVVSGPRVGLTLKKTDGDRAYFIMKNYRFMCQPLKVRKGRRELVLGLYSIGKSAKEIKEISGCAVPNVQKYLDLFEEGKKLKKENLEEFKKKEQEYQSG